MDLQTSERQDLINTITSLQKEIEILKESNYNKKTWLALLSHDCKGVFANLIWLLNTYKSKSISTEMLIDLLPDLEINAQKNLKALDDTLLAAIIQYDNILTEKEEINLNETVLEIQNLLSDAISEKKLSLDFVSNDNISIINNKLIVNSVLIKIIDNAIKYSFEGGKITCTVNRVENNKTRITIEDFGTGIDEHTFGKLYSLERGSYNGTNDEKGAGLGLILAKEALSLIDGTIQIDSTIDKGTQVKIVL